MIDERKNVQTTPTRTYCKRNRPLPYSIPNKQDAPALEVYPAPSHHPTTPSKEQPVLKKATLEMMRKDWQKQQQRERQLNNKPSSPKTKTSNAKIKPQKAQSNKPVVSDRQSKGSKDELQLHNKFDILSDESEMEFVDTLDHAHITDTVSWSPILPPSP